jgi:hypothetical protein
MAEGVRAVLAEVAALMAGKISLGRATSVELFGTAPSLLAGAAVQGPPVMAVHPVQVRPAALLELQ